ncbi:MAG: hypothetical protein ACTSRI_22150 [Promethearchaeota archaeon]
MSDPFFQDSEKKKNKETRKKEDKKPTLFKKPTGPISTPQKIQNVKEKHLKNEKGKVKTKKPEKKKSKSINIVAYTNRQRITATILYISIVIACLITIAGGIWAVADIFMITGKLNLFLSLSFGYQIAIIGGFLAGFFFLIIFFYGLFKKGVKILIKIIFKSKEIEEEYQNRKIVKIIIGLLMLSIFAIIIGTIISIVIDLIVGSSDTISLSIIFAAFDSTGPFVFFLGIFLLVMNALAFALNYLWYNGYYLILKMIGDLEAED